MAASRILALAALAAAVQLTAFAGQANGPTLSLTGLPERVFSGQSLTLRLSIGGLRRAEAEVEVTTLLANRSVGRTIWKVPLKDGGGDKDIPVTIPEARSRVSFSIAAKVLSAAPPPAVQLEAVIVPRWNPDRLTELLRTKEIAVVDREKLVAPALGKAPSEEISAGDPLGVERFRGDLLVCHIAQLGPASEDVVTAIAHQLQQGRSVVWLTLPDEQAPPMLHGGPLVSVQWPFALRAERELPDVLPGDVLHWAGKGSSLSLPLIASFGTSRLIVCPDQVLTDMAQEPAAGWVWEDVLAWATKKSETPPKVKRLAFSAGTAPPAPGAEGEGPAAALLSLAGDDWVQPDDQRVEWLSSLRVFVERGNALLIAGANSDRSAALSALGVPRIDFIPVTDAPDLLLEPNLLLWGIGKTDPSYGLLVKRREKALLDAYASGRTGTQLFREFKVGKGVLLLSQPDFDESATSVEHGLLEHLALQLLTPPGRALLDAESSR
ncbi:MAG: hypothetical protein ABSD48_14410 [Armatimonadota bacterium]